MKPYRLVERMNLRKRALFGALQVDRAFDGEGLDEAPATKKRGPQAIGESSEQRPSKRQADRHRQWLSSRSALVGATKASWRPVRLHRVGAKRWLANVDNQLRVMMGSGLSLLVPDERDPRWSCWRSWPYCAFAADLGSDGVCAIKSLEYRWKANCDLWPDVAHACNRDLEAALRGQKLYAFWLCMVLVWNMPYGPWREHQRLHQLSEALQDLYSNQSIAETPLFTAKSAGIIRCLKRQGYTFEPDSPEEDQAWQMMATRPWAGDRGCRISLSRFCGSIHACQRQVPWWEVQEFERTYLALESDLLTPKAVAERCELKHGSGDQAVTGESSTNPQRFSFEDRFQAKAIENAVVHSVLMLEKPANFRVCTAIAAAGQHLIAFYTDFSKRVVSADSTEKWVCDMVDGGIAEHLQAIFSEPFGRPSLERAGFAVGESLKGLPAEEVITEDEHAELFGNFCFRLAGHRARRLLHLSSGWPFRVARCLLGDEQAKNTLAELRQDFRIFEELKDAEGLPGIVARMLSRSVFMKTSTLQLVAGAEEYEWSLGTDLEALIRNRSRLMVGTIAVEETLGVQKNTRMSAAQRRFKKPETSFFVALKANMLAKRQKYKTIVAEVPVERKLDRLPADNFRAMKHNRSMNFNEIVSASSSTTWYSPSGQNITAPIADLLVFRECDALGNFDRLDGLWLGDMVDVAHMTVFRHTKVHDEGIWFFGLLRVHDSGVLAWPGRLVAVAGTAHVYWEPDGSCQGPIVTGFCDVSDDMLACSLSWRSWLWQTMNLGKASETMVPSLRCFVSFGPASFLVAAAMEGFWDLKHSLLERLARHVNADLPTNTGNLCEVVFSLVRHITKKSDDEVATILGKRLAWNDAAVLFASDLLDCDEALGVMDERDTKKVQEEQKAAHERTNARAAFSKDYRTKVASVRSSASSTRTGGGSRRASSSSSARAPKQGIPSDICQSSAKRYLPPKASIWRDNTRFAWNAHLETQRRMSEPWRDNSSLALQRILRRIWSQYLELHALEWDSCPYSFASEPAQAAADRASSS